MNRFLSHRPGSSAQQGVALIAALLLLIIMTIMAISMFRSVGVQGKIAGNVMEKQRALNAAESAQQFAENWLATANLASGDVVCSGVQAATMSSVQTCSNILSQVTSVTTVPWMIGATEVGFSFDPTGLSTGGPNPYAGLPKFYISDVGTYATAACGEVFRIDAWGYAGTTGTVAVVESNYVIQPLVPNLGSLTC
jgi:type IV pilus assembly protein PilX